MADQGTTSETSGTQGTPEVPVPEEAPPAIEDVVTREVLENILKSHDSDLELVDYTAEMGSQAGDNYMSIMYAVSINTKSRTNGAEKTFHIMLKTLPRNNFRQQMINEMKAFEKEGSMYSKVFRDMIDFQKEKGVEAQEMFDAFPLCYSCFINGTADYLAMEDLRPSGFRMGNRQMGLDEQHTKLAMTNLAKFHATSYAMFEGDYDKILEKYPFLEERMFKKPEDVDDVMKAYMKQTYHSEGATLRKAGFEREAELVEGVYDDDFFGRLRKLVGEKNPKCVIGHGDCWTNNMLFLYDADGKPIKHKFLDFQMSRASSRTIDLGYFLYSSPTMSMVDREDELLKLYHDVFTSFAQKLGYTNDELTYEQLQQEMDDFRPYGITMGLMLAPILNANKENIPDMENLEFDIQDQEGMQDKTKQFYDELMQSDSLNAKMVYIANKHILRCAIWNKSQ